MTRGSRALQIAAILTLIGLAAVGYALWAENLPATETVWTGEDQVNEELDLELDNFYGVIVQGQFTRIDVLSGGVDIFRLCDVDCNRYVEKEDNATYVGSFWPESGPLRVIIEGNGSWTIFRQVGSPPGSFGAGCCGPVVLVFGIATGSVGLHRFRQGRRWSREGLVFLSSTVHEPWVGLVGLVFGGLFVAAGVLALPFAALGRGDWFDAFWIFFVALGLGLLILRFSAPLMRRGQRHFLRGDQLVIRSMGQDETLPLGKLETVQGQIPMGRQTRDIFDIDMVLPDGRRIRLQTAAGQKDLARIRSLLEQPSSLGVSEHGPQGQRNGRGEPSPRLESEGRH